MMKHIHVNRNILASNKKHGTDHAPITVKILTPSGKSCSMNEYGHRVEVLGPSTFVYDEENPLSCGARVWVETDAPVKIIHNSFGEKII